MRVFTCENCGQLVYFENSRCERCGSELGFRSDTVAQATLRLSEDGGAFEPLAAPGLRLQRCGNAAVIGCNWLAPEDEGPLCRACALGHRIPDPEVPGNLAMWRSAEAAKRRLVYALLRFGLPVETQHGVKLTFETASAPPPK
jgi:hypothetical protein